MPGVRVSAAHAGRRNENNVRSLYALTFSPISDPQSKTGYVSQVEHAERILYTEFDSLENPLILLCLKKYKGII